MLTMIRVGFARTVISPFPRDKITPLPGIRFVVLTLEGIFIMPAGNHFRVHCFDRDHLLDGTPIETRSSNANNKG
jgi:hypothetical protein